LQPHKQDTIQRGADDLSYAPKLEQVKEQTASAASSDLQEEHHHQQTHLKTRGAQQELAPTLPLQVVHHLASHQQEHLLSQQTTLVVTTTKTIRLGKDELPSDNFQRRNVL